MRFYPHTPEHLPKNASPLYRWWATFVTRVVFGRGEYSESFLTEEDFNDSLKILKPGDLILVGSRGRFLARATGSVSTHAAVYVGDGKAIQAMPDGVEEVSYGAFFKNSDTLIVLRPTMSDEQQDAVVATVYAKLGVPFDFAFDKDDDSSLYCSELICHVYNEAGVKTDVCQKKSFYVLPKDFLQDGFEVMFTSKSVKHENGEFTFNEEIAK